MVYTDFLRFVGFFGGWGVWLHLWLVEVLRQSMEPKS